MNKLLAFTLVLFAACRSPQARYPVTAKTAAFTNTSIQRNKQQNALERGAIAAFLKKEKKKYIASNHGFWYTYNTKADSGAELPQFNDTIQYNYSVKTLEGTTVYTASAVKMQRHSLHSQELFTGLREGLALMKAGETVTFVFPSQKAYGYYGDGNKIASRMPIVCRVTVKAITQSKVPR